MALNTAIRYLKKGEWQKAHEIAQQDETKLGCWAHGIVHLVEGDLGNAPRAVHAGAGRHGAAALGPRFWGQRSGRIDK